MRNNLIGINKNLNLCHEDDQKYFLDILRTIQEFSWQIDQIDDLLHFLINHLDEEWFHLDGSSLIALKTSDHIFSSISFVDGLIPLGNALLKLSKLRHFDRLLMRLNQKSHERMSALLEACSAALFAGGEYGLLLEPETSRGKFPDFSLSNNSERIYFECKVENRFATSFFSRSKDFQRISELIGAKLAGLNLASVSIDTTKILSNKKIDGLCEKIRRDYVLDIFNQDRDYEGILYKITEGSGAVAPSISKIIYFGISDKNRIKQLLKSAITQIPEDSDGVVIINVNNMEDGDKVFSNPAILEHHPNIRAIVLINYGDAKVISRGQCEVDNIFQVITKGPFPII